jgi:hypothetical protein
MARRLSIHRRLENLETIRRSGSGTPIGPQPDVTAAIADYLESLREWIRSGASGKPRGHIAGDSAGRVEALLPNPIATPVKWSVSDYRSITGIVQREQENRSRP